MCLLDHLGEVIDLTISVGILDQHPAHGPGGKVKVVEVVHHCLHPQVAGPGLDDGQGVRMDVPVHVEHVVLIVLELPGVTPETQTRIQKILAVFFKKN